MQLPNIISRVFAQQVGGTIPQGTTVSIPNPLGQGSTILGILEKISVYLIIIGAPLTAIMIIWGAFQILTAGGDPGKAKSGGKTILLAAVGYGIILISWGIISLVKELLGVTAS